MKKYYKRYAESDFGEGMVFIEITDGWPSRQIEIYEENWRMADEMNNEYLADQPFDKLGLLEENEIKAVEFEAIWREAQRKCQ